MLNLQQQNKHIMKNHVLGLDLGTNSIGWALVEYEKKADEAVASPTRIVDMGSRILPMDAAAISDFDRGILQSAASERTQYRSIRRLRERFLLRRERLHRVLHQLGFLPDHYAREIDFDKRLGQFKPGAEPLLAYYRADSGFCFYFEQAFADMLLDFATHQPQLVSDGKKVPYDWTIYYLRKKALQQPISKEELAWLILHFNQKRGYYEQRGDAEELDKTEVYAKLEVAEVIDTGERNKKGEKLFRVRFTNDWVYEKSSYTALDWVGKTLELIVTTTEKKGETKRTFRLPKEEDWILVKTRTEQDIRESGLTPGAYIYDTLLRCPDQKIRGGLIQTIDRVGYRNELTQILKKQQAFHPELQDGALYAQCVTELYRSNAEHRQRLSRRDLVYLLVDDLVFYHRPLKSKKSLISTCPYEYHWAGQPGNKEKRYLRCIPRSHPLFEEFRLWQFLKQVHLKRVADGADVTHTYLPNEESYVALFDVLRKKKEIDQKSFLASIAGAKLKEADFSWNYGDRKLPVCPTHAEFVSRLKKAGLPEAFLLPDREEHLWHLMYSVTDPVELQKALQSFAVRYDVADPEAFVQAFVRLKPFESDYASYSAKAIKKLLALMRMGHYWDPKAIDAQTAVQINQLIDGEESATLTTQTREKVLQVLGDTLTFDHFRGLPLWLACYVVYNRHSEASETSRWESPEDIDRFLFAFKQHALRNPVVEQVVTETLRVVRDVWARYGAFSAIHIELGREMKNSADKRRALTDRQLENEKTNQRIKALLTELRKDGLDVRPESASQQERLKIFEEGALGARKDLPDDIRKITRDRTPSAADVVRYKCWLEQRYCSPYTGNIIPLSRLFTSDYQVDHILPKVRYYDDSLSNKVICEGAINGEKEDWLACEYVRKHGGTTVNLGNGKQARVLSYEAYEAQVKRHYPSDSLKGKKLLMDDIPDAFIERQLNDTRYISRYIKSLLSNVVREPNEQEATSKNMVPVTGAITAKLKEDWGLNEVWNRLVTPRFCRLNKLKQTNEYGYWVDPHTFRTQVPEGTLGFSKKRIDHRHHALDALVIACTTRMHVNYLNNQSARSGETALRDQEKNTLFRKKSTGRKLLHKPWDTFTEDAQKALAAVVVSFKQNVRILNRTVNRYQRFVAGEKKTVRQTQGNHWAIRKPLHKETVSGQVNLRLLKRMKLAKAVEQWQQIANREVRSKIAELVQRLYSPKEIVAYFKHLDYWYAKQDVSALDVYVFSNDVGPLSANRKALNSEFTPKNVQQVTDSGIRKILERHLESCGANAEAAFSAEGLAQMNRDMRRLNNGHPHKPIGKVRLYETTGAKFALGERGNKAAKQVEAAKGTNLFFAVYQQAEGKRSFETLPLTLVIERLKQGASAVPERNEKGEPLLFSLSPYDLVYVPTPDQLGRPLALAEIEANKDRIYKMVSATRYQSYFVPYYIATPIEQTTELGDSNKAERAWTGEMIKEICLKVHPNRLGHLEQKQGYGYD